ncbi:MAG: TIGR02186 family protein [Acidithiobacillus sp.]|nr:TIGR02186 family protein [Acidithiobacillus sp.]
MMTRAILFLGCLMAMAAHAADRPLVTELNKHSVDITARYTGDRLLLFGAMPESGDVVVKVSSPAEKISIDRKENLGPFWLSGHKHVVEGVPGVYYLLSSAPISSIASADARARYGLTLDAVFARMTANPLPQHEAAMRAAILRIKEADQHFLVRDNAVTLAGGGLFYVSIPIPARLPLGQYTIQTLFLKNGTVVAAESKVLNVDEVRMEHWISQVAENSPWRFGAIFVALVLILGLGLGIFLNRSRA